MKRLTNVIVFACVVAFLSIGWNTPMRKTASRVEFGKIFLTDTHLFVGEIFKGVNIYDVAKPSDIHSVGYISLVGNNDVAVQGDILYADSYENLVIYDISDPASPRRIDSLLKVFTAYQAAPEVRNQLYDNGGSGASGCSHIGCSQDQSISPVYDNAGVKGSGTGGNTGGKSGSMARFVIVDSWLYCIDQQNLIVFDIRDPRKPVQQAKVNIGFGIETLFQYQYYLFIGSTTGMYIYDARDIKIPVKVAEFRHARACDPVVVEGNRAYVTLRSSGWCGPADDALHIVNIESLTNPVLVTTVPMDGPMGLAVSDGTAYVCDGSLVKIIDVKDENNPRELSRISLLSTYDCIYSNHLLYVTGPMGIYVYDVSDLSNPVQVAHISNIHG